MAKFCPNCGSSVKAKDRFCNECGTALQSATASKSRTKSSATPFFKTRLSPTTLWLTGSVVAFALIATAVVWLLPGPETDVVRVEPVAQQSDDQAAKTAEASIEPDIGFFGVEVSDVTTTDAGAVGAGSQRGARVHKIVPWGPAHRVDVREKDVVIKIGDQPVANMESFLKQTAQLKPDTQTNLTILRNRTERVIPVAVGAFLRDTLPAANAGDTQAMRLLADIYFSERLGKADPAEAIQWLRKAADIGDQPSTYALASRLWTGTDVAKDRNEARRLFKAAADKGHVEAIMSLGRIHYSGVDGEKNHQEAMRLFLLAADQGNGNAMRLIGYMHQQGWGTKKNLAEASRWYRKAADKGDANAMYSLGLSYDLGRGVAKNHSEAAIWYQKAIDLNSKLSPYNLAALYHDGDGVKRDRQRAAELAYRALKLGHEFAVNQFTNNASAWHPTFRRHLQDLMRRDGLYEGASDGKFGPASKRAIRAVAERAKQQPADTKTATASSPGSGQDAQPATLENPDLDLGDLRNLGTLD